MQRYSNQTNRVINIVSTSVESGPLGRPRVHSAAKRLGDEAVTQLIVDYRSGVPTTQLMTKYGIGKGTVLRLLEANGVPRRNQPLTPAQVSKVIELYKRGYSLARIGEYLGRQHTVIRDVLKRAGVPRRDSHGRPRN
jgi:hypothetical protein